MKKLILLLALCLTAYILNAQTPNKQSNSLLDPQKIVYGGSIGGGYSSNNDFWSLNISPQVGYWLTKNLVAGVGVSYMYTSEKPYYYFNTDEKNKRGKETSNLFGLNVFGNYHITRQLFVTAKPEIFYSRESSKYEGVKDTNNEFVSALVLGVGLYLRPVSISLNYDVIQDNKTPYGDNVFISVAFMF